MASRIGIALVLALAAAGLWACGDDEEGDGGDTSVAELASRLPTADDLGLEERSNSDWDDARTFLAGELVIGGGTNPSDLSAELDDAGFQQAAGSSLGGRDLNVRLRAVEFDSEAGALEARDLLHAEDLKAPCPDACIVTPIEYELDDVPDSVAVHHVPTKGDLPPGHVPIEAHHAEFVIGPELYIAQVDGRPSPEFSADFDELMSTVYASASSDG